MKKGNSLFALLLSIIMVFSFTPSVFAEAIPATPDSVFKTIEEEPRTVADYNSRYVTLFTQDPDTGLITATVQLHNANAPGGESMLIDSLNTYILFNESVYPVGFAADDSMLEFTEGSPILFGGESVSDLGSFENYFTYAPDLYEELGDVGFRATKQVISNDDTHRLVAALHSGVLVGQAVAVAPGETIDVVSYYFMPVEEGAELSLDMFDYGGRRTIMSVREQYELFMGYSAEESYVMVVSGGEFNPRITNLYIHPDAYKLHVQPAMPDVSVDENGNVSGFDPNKMEWSSSPEGTYTSALESPITDPIYVRYKGSADYETSEDPLFPDYKKYVESEPVKLDPDNADEPTEPIPAPTPTINDVYEDDSTIEGTDGTGDSIPDATITIEIYDENDELVDTVTGVEINDDGTWSIDLEDEGITIEKDYTIKATQVPPSASEDYLESEAVETVVKPISDKAQAPTPTIDDVYDNSTIITGDDNADEDATKLPGATITVEIYENDDDDTPIYTIVISEEDDEENDTFDFADDGTWTIDLDEINKGLDDEEQIDLGDGYVIKAVQDATDFTTSDEAVMPVIDTGLAGMEIDKTSENQTKPDRGVTYVGDVIKYTITVESTGTNPLSKLVDVTVKDLLPDGLNYADADDIAAILSSIQVTDAETDELVSVQAKTLGDDPATDEVEDNVLIIKLGDMPNGTVYEVTFEAKVGSVPESGVIENTAEVSAKDSEDDDADDVIESDEDEGQEVEEKPEPQFGTKTSVNLTAEAADPAREDNKAFVGDELVYTINFENKSEMDLTNVTLVDLLPGEQPEDGDYIPYIDFEGGLMIGGEPAEEGEGKDYIYDEDTFTLTIFLGDVPAAEEGDEPLEITFNATINTNAYGETIINSVDVNADEEDESDPFDPIVEDNDDEVGGEQGHEVDDGVDAEKISELVEDDTELVLPGDMIKYTIRLTNNREAAWENLTFVDFIPDYITFDQDAGVQVSYNGGELVPLTDVSEEGIEEGTDGYAYYAEEEPIEEMLEVSLESIGAGESIDVVFYVTIDEELDEAAYGKTIENSITLTDKDGEKDITDEDPIELPEQSEKPTVDDVFEGDDSIGGKGEPGADIIVKVPTDDQEDEDGYVDLGPVVVDPDGNWSIDDLGDYEPEKDDIIIVEQTEDGKAPNDEVTKVKRRVEVTFNSDGGRFVETGNARSITMNVIVDEAYPEFPALMPRNNFTFNGWYTEPDGGGTKILPGAIVTIDEDHELYADWTANQGNNDIVVTFDPTDGDLSNPTDNKRTVTVGERYNQNEAFPTVRTRTNYNFVGWFTADGTQVRPGDTVTITTAHTLFARWTEVEDTDDEPERNNPIKVDPTPGGGGTVTIDDPETPLVTPPVLMTDEHIPYIFGYPDQSVRPDAAITRAEVAMIFYNLVQNTEKDTPIPAQFSDVAGSAWYAQAVNYLAATGILSGYADGTFAPDALITRAEFATIATKFDELNEVAENAFPDVDDSHWAKVFINTAAANGWVSGYEDGTFKPNTNITRAEVVSVVNRVLGRGIRLENIPEGIVYFTDYNEGHWAYTDMVEASNWHDYTGTAGNELWTLR